MKLLIIGDSLLGFGTEIYALNILNLFKEKGWDVKYLFFNGAALDKKRDVQIKLNRIEKILGKVINAFSIEKKIKQEVDTFSPDLVLLNNDFTAPFSALSACKGYKTIRVIHDCRCICHVGICMNEKREICKGYLYGNCYKCGRQGERHFSYLHVFLKKYIQRKMNKSYIKEKVSFIFPSDWLREYCINYGIVGTTINNFVDTETISFSPTTDRKRYCYIGGLSVYKGVDVLLNEFRAFSEGRNVELYIAGPLDEYSRKKSLLYKNDKIHFVGVLPHNKINSFLQDKFCVIVSSIIMDNYPTSVIEGMLAGKLIIGSNRGGIPSMISDNGFLFDPKEEGDLEKKLELSQSIDQKRLNTMLDCGYKKMKGIDSDYYYSEIIKIYYRNNCFGESI